MKRSNIARCGQRHILVFAATMLIVLIASATVAHAQSRQRGRTAKTSTSKSVDGQAPTKNFTLYSGTPIVHKAFTSDELQDPATGKKLSEVSTVTTKSGIKMKASEYLIEVNQLEQTLNEAGLTLRSAPSNKTLYKYEAPKSTLSMMEKSINESLVAKPATLGTMRSTGAVPSKGKTKSASTGSASTGSASTGSASTGSASTSSSSKTPIASIVTESWDDEWEKSYGDDETFAVELSAGAKLIGASNYVEAEGQAEVKASVFKKDITLASAKAYAYMTTDDRNEKLQFTVKVAGEEIPGSFNKEFDIPSEVLENSVSAGDNWTVANIPIAGVIPLTLKIKVGYEVEAGYALGFGGFEVYGNAELTASANATASVSLDLKVASASVDGNVELVKYEGTLLNSIGYSDGKFVKHSSLCHEFSLVSGSLVGIIDLPTDRWDIEEELFSWDGYSTGSKCSWIYE